MEPIEWALIGGKIKGFFKGLFKSPWFYVALAFLAIGGGTYLYLNHSTKQQVNQAVAHADDQATIDTYHADDKARQMLQPLDEKAEQKAAQTRKDYEHARQNVIAAPTPERQGSAPPLIIGTLNDLDRLSRSREDADGVPTSEVRSH